MNIDWDKHQTAKRFGMTKKMTLVENRAVICAEMDIDLFHEASETIFAIRNLGGFLSDANNKALLDQFEAAHLSAIGIAIEQLAGSLDRGILAMPEPYSV